jgi:hypothetical protein
VRLYVPPGRNVHALHALLRLAARRFGLEVGNVHEIHELRAPTKKNDVTRIFEGLP